MKTIGIAGGSGFVGRHLSQLLTGRGYRVIVFTRKAQPGNGLLQYAVWQPDRQMIDREALSGVDTMVNLAGAGVTDKRWTATYKKEILSSRVDATYFLLDALKTHAPRCATYISAAATGIYGPDQPGMSPFTETAPPYHDFLAEVCRQWETAALSQAAVYRTVILRLGIVLGKEGGAYPELAGPMKWGIMPILGHGHQVVSWVHVADVAAMLAYALEQTSLSGTYNCVAPQPVPHELLMQTIARVKGGWKLPVPVPAFALKLIMGASGVEVLKSCTVSADKISHAGFIFQYPQLREAVQSLQ